MCMLNNQGEIELTAQELEIVRNFFSTTDGEREDIDRRVAEIETRIESLTESQRVVAEIKLRGEIFGQPEPLTVEDVESAINGLNLETPETVFEINVLDAVITAAKDGGSITATQALGN